MTGELAFIDGDHGEFRITSRMVWAMPHGGAAAFNAAMQEVGKTHPHLTITRTDDPLTGDIILQWCPTERPNREEIQ